MVSESGRLSRFLHGGRGPGLCPGVHFRREGSSLDNVLDFGRIEQDVKSYRFRPIVVQDILLAGDEDALKQALMNLIDNAI